MTRNIGIGLECTVLETALNAETASVSKGFRAFVQQQHELGNKIRLIANASEADSQKLRSALEKEGFFKSFPEGGYGFQASDLQLNETGSSSWDFTHYIEIDEDTFPKEFLPESAQFLILSPVGGAKEIPTFADWSEISRYFEWESGLREQTASHLVEIHTLKGHGQNFIYKLVTADGNAYVLKNYLNEAGDAQVRLQAEFDSLDHLRKVGVKNVPQTFWRHGCWALYEFIEGQRVTQPTKEDLDQLVEMLAVLDKKNERLRRLKLELAPDARLNLRSYVDALNKKWNAILGASQKPDGFKDVLFFMLTDLEQMRQDNLNHFYLWCKRQNWNLDKPFLKKELIFSLGDFGFHNTMRTADGKLAFLDLETAGWDDPAKVMADFFYNSEQAIPTNDKLQVLDGFVKARGWDKNFISHFYAVSDLVAVEWILKIMKVAIPDEMRRYQYANPGVNPKEVIQERLALAAQLKKSYQPMEHICKHSQLLESSEF